MSRATTLSLESGCTAISDVQTSVRGAPKTTPHHQPLPFTLCHHPTAVGRGDGGPVKNVLTNLHSHPGQSVPRERSQRPCRDSSSPPPSRERQPLIRRRFLPLQNRVESQYECAIVMPYRPCGRPSPLSWLHCAKFCHEVFASRATTSWLDRILRDMWEWHEFCGFQAHCKSVTPVQLG